MKDAELKKLLLSPEELADIIKRNGLPDDEFGRALAQLWFHSIELVGPWPVKGANGNAECFRRVRNDITHKVFSAEIEGKGHGQGLRRFIFDLETGERKVRGGIK